MGFHIKDIFHRPAHEKEVEDGNDVYNDPDYFNRKEQTEEAEQALFEQEAQRDSSVSSQAVLEKKEETGPLLMASDSPQETPQSKRIYDARDWVADSHEGNHEEDATFTPIPVENQGENSAEPTKPIPRLIPPVQEPAVMDFYEEAEEETAFEEAPSTKPEKKPGLKEKLTGLFSKGKPKKPKAAKAKKTKKEEKKKEESDPKKVAVLGLLLVVLAGLGYWLFSMFSPGLFASNPVNPTNPNGNQVNKAKAGTVVQDSSNPAIPPNPFVPKASVAALAVVEGVYPKAADAALPAVPQGSAPQVTYRQQPPSVPSFTPPRIPQSAPQVKSEVTRIIPLPGTDGKIRDIPSLTPEPAENEPPRLTGIIEGEDGNNVAIMSDGTVVSSGDTYQDGRIAYIGGDGIHFDNGNTMRFEQ